MSVAVQTFSLLLNNLITGILDDMILANKEVRAIYNLQGIQVNENTKGLLIYQFTDGTSAKIFVE